MEYMKSELDLFVTPPLQTNILKTEEVALNPIASLDNSSTLEFVSVGGGDTYRDLSSIYLRLVVAVENDPTEVNKEHPKMSVVNNLLHSLFKSCNVYLNNVCVSSDNLYHYRSYIENILSYGGDSVKTHLTSCGWLLDSGNFDSIDNDGMKKRKEWFKNGRQVELYGKVHADLFNQSKLLLNNVDLKVVFNLEKPSFYMITESNDVDGNKIGKNLSIKLYSATMYMKHVTINPDILRAHHVALSRQPAVYPYKRVEVKPFTIYSGNQSLSLDNVVIGPLPNLIIFAMVSSKAYNGSNDKTPYNFQHYKIQRLSLSVNSVQIPTQALEFKFGDTGNISTRGYQTLFNGLGIHYHDRGHQITKELFDNGAFLTAFDLTADQCYNSHYDNLLNQGSLRIEGRFESALPEAVTCLVYCEFDSCIHIDKNRNISIQ